MYFPVRVLLALFVVGAFGGIGAWAIFAILRARSMTAPQRIMAAAGIVILMVALAAWVILLWSVYWD